MFAFLAFMSRSLAQNAVSQTNAVFIFRILILSSTSGRRQKLQLEKLFVHLFTMKYWYGTSHQLLLIWYLLFSNWNDSFFFLLIFASSDRVP